MRKLVRGIEDTSLDGAVVAAKTADLSYVVKLQRVWSNAVGFVTRSGLRQKIQRDQVLVVRVGGLEAGYLLHGCARDGVLLCSQVAVAPEVLRSTLGTQLLVEMFSRAFRYDAGLIRLRCRRDLEANRVWPRLGFVRSAVIRRKSSRGVEVWEWSRGVDLGW